MNRGLFLLMMAAILLVVGCKKELRVARVVEEKFGIEPFEFTYLTSKAKFKYDDGNQKVAAQITFRIKKDSVIWASISPGLGIEAARLLVTAEGVQMLDKIKRDYYYYDYRALSKSYGFEVTFELIEALVVGNVLYHPEKRREIDKDDRFFSFGKEVQGFGIVHSIGKHSKKLERLQAYQIDSDNSIVVNYGGFEKLGEQKVAQKVRARVKFDDKSKEDAVIDIEYSKMDTQNEPLDFPFQVSNKYTRK
jgi:hypothetical protein